MGDGKILNKIQKYAVRIGIEDNNKTLIGSGVLYPVSYGKDIYVLTVAHVATELRNRIENENVRGQISCLCLDDQQKEYNISVVEPDNIYIYSKYIESGNGDNKEYFADLAMIRIPWGGWCNTLEAYHPMYNLEIETELKGLGFPQALDKEKDKRAANLLSGIGNFAGQVENVDEKRIGVKYLLNIESEISRDSALEGYSGTGLFFYDNQHIYLAGLISCSRGDKTAGGRLWATNINLLKDLMAENNIKSDYPESFQIYSKSIEREFPAFRGDSLINWRKLVNELLKDNYVVPRLFEEQLDSQLLCEGDRMLCPFFWKEKLKELVVLYGAANIEKEHMKYPILQLPEPYNIEKVTLEFICTELEATSVLGEMIKNNQFTKEGFYHNNTIILLNSKKGHDNCYIKFLRKDCRYILKDIAQVYEHEYVTANDFCDKLENLIDNYQADIDVDFDIVRGQIEKCNIAALGTGALMDILNQDTTAEMKTKWDQLLGELWKEKN